MRLCLVSCIQRGKFENKILGNVNRAEQLNGLKFYCNTSVCFPSKWKQLQKYWTNVHAAGGSVWPSLKLTVFCRCSMFLFKHWQPVGYNHNVQNRVYRKRFSKYCDFQATERHRYDVTIIAYMQKHPHNLNEQKFICGTFSRGCFYLRATQFKLNSFKTIHVIYLHEDNSSPANGTKQPAGQQ